MAFTSNDNDDAGFSEINITPFVDVVLVLLVIFMVTAPMMLKSVVEMKLPSATMTEQAETKVLGITVLRTGTILLDGEPVSPEDLEIRSKKLLSEDSKVQAIIRADKNSTHGMVIEVIDIIKTAGIENFAFQVEKKVKNDKTDKSANL